MRKNGAILAVAVAIGAAGGKLSSGELKGTAFVTFSQSLPDGGVRELGRTGCYDLSKVQATVEPCGKSMEKQ